MLGRTHEPNHDPSVDQPAMSKAGAIPAALSSPIQLLAPFSLGSGTGIDSHLLHGPLGIAIPNDDGVTVALGEICQSNLARRSAGGKEVRDVERGRACGAVEMRMRPLITRSQTHVATVDDDAR
jgi:hypothetical protein